MKAFMGGLLAGLVVGALLMTMASRVIDSRRDRWPDAVMGVLDHEFKTLREASSGSSCGGPVASASLQRMQLMAQDIEPALMSADGEDRVFRQYAAELRKALDAVGAAGADCPRVAAAITLARNACQSCHRDYR